MFWDSLFVNSTMVLGCLLGEKEKTLYEKIFNYKGMAVLGMSASGKTSFLYNLCNEIDKSEQTITSPYERFVIEDKDFKFKIASNDDIGGSEDLCPYYPAYIEASDISLFFFNAKKYIEDYDYRFATNCRFDFITRHGFLSEKRDHGVIGTHLDEFDTEGLLVKKYNGDSEAEFKLKNLVNGIKRRIIDLNKDKDYKSILLDHFFLLVDMRRKEEAFHILKKFK